MDYKIVTGDACSLLFPLKNENNKSFVISDTAVVKYTLISGDRKTTLIETPVASLKTFAGSDWTKSIVCCKFTRNDTKDISYTGKAFVEIQITENIGTENEYDSTWFYMVDLIKGYIE